MTESEYAARWKANAAGVDLNRNFAAGWDGLDGREEPSCELYPGERPEDQPESRALAGYTRDVQPDATVSLHTSGSVIYAEYGDAAANSASMSLAESVSALTGYSISDTESLDAGGYKDWVQSTIGAASITIELGFGDSPQDAGAISSTLARGISIPQTVAEWLSKQ